MAKELANADGSIDVSAAEEAFDAYEQQHVVAEEEDTKAGKPADETPPKPSDEEDDDEDDGEPAAGDAGDEEGDDWVSREDVRELVESLGLSAEEVAEFSGPEELERAARLLDRRLMEAGRQAREKPGEAQEAALAAEEAARTRQEAQQRAAEQPRGQDGKFTSDDGEAGDYRPEITADYYDEALVGEFNRLDKHQADRIRQLESRLESFASQLEERSTAQEIERFDAIVDQLDEGELFGAADAIQPDSDPARNRAKLWEAVDTLRDVMAAQGKRATLTPALVRLALSVEFADKVSERQRRDFSRRVQQQSQRRLGSGGRRNAGPDRPWTGDPERDPVLLEAYAAMERENG